jgi:hypothetical protein
MPRVSIGESSWAIRRETRDALRAVDGYMTTHRIAVIPGDGIGTEVVPEGLRVLEAAARRCARSRSRTRS